jgi:hypothetical protein
MTSGRSGQLVLDVVIDRSKLWQRKHVQSIRQAYSKAPFFDSYFGALEELLDRPWERLVDLDVAVIGLMASWLGLDVSRIVLSSTLGIPRGRNERLLSLCEHFGATNYLSGNLAKTYLDVAAFQKRGVSVEWQDFSHPVYEQMNGPFEPYLSALDLVLNVGAGSLRVIRQGRPRACTAATRLEVRS